MKLHGKNPQQSVIAIIPARYGSTRLEGKLLLTIGEKPLILHTVEQAKRARGIDDVIVATEDVRILQAVRGAGHHAVMTSDQHLSGSDRIAEAAAELPRGTVIVNVQGDEPMISPETIEAAVEAYLRGGCDIATTSEPITDAEDVFNPNIVKVVAGGDGLALYFSRSPMPYLREAANEHGSLKKALETRPELLSHFRKHSGLYVYNREYLLKFTETDHGRLEKLEMLEQLRALESGGRIRVVEVNHRSISVDTAEDLEAARILMVK